MKWSQSLCFTIYSHQQPTHTVVADSSYEDQVSFTSTSNNILIVRVDSYISLFLCQRDQAVPHSYIHISIRRFSSGPGPGEMRSAWDQGARSQGTRVVLKLFINIVLLENVSSARPFLGLFVFRKIPVVEQVADIRPHEAGMSRIFFCAVVNQ